MPRHENPKYKDIESIMVRLDPISKCIDCLMESIPKTPHWQGIMKYRKIREVGLKMVNYSDSILKVFDKDYEPCELAIPADFVEPAENTSSNLLPQNNEHTPKRIMGTYYNHTYVASLCDYKGDEMMQAVARTFYTWFFERYNSNSESNKSNKLWYRWDVIIEYIDRFIVAAAYSIHNHTFQAFSRGVLDWTLARQRGETIESLPVCVTDLCFDLNVCPLEVFTPEIICIEKNLKSIIYSNNFFPEYQHTITNLMKCRGLESMVIQGQLISVLPKQEV